MKRETLDLIHEKYQESLHSSHNILEIVQNLYNLLNDVDVDVDDIPEFDAFLKGLDDCINTRCRTFEFTNIASDILFVIMYIVVWLNNTKKANIDLNLNARRKSLESDLTKVLNSSKPNSPGIINDRFGLRGIILNDTSYENALNLVDMISNNIIGILVNTNRKAREEFWSWVNNNPKIDVFTQTRIVETLCLPFNVEITKDYINNPKPNGYQSLHFIIALGVQSTVLPGAKFEIQFRTNKMHQFATNGKAAHGDYKNNRISDEAKNIFTVDDFSELNIVGFTSYNSPEDDIDGVHFGKVFANRRISPSLVR